MEARTVSTTTGVRFSPVSIDKMLRNTYALLASSLLFSAITAAISLAFNMPHPGLIITLAAYFGLLFLTNKYQNSAWGLLCVFALTGFMGLSLGPILSAYLSLPGGGQIVMTAMGFTSLIFFSLSAYVLTTRKDFSFMASFLFIGILVMFFAGLGAYFFKLPALSLAVSAGFVLLMSGLILYETSNIIHGGERNYIMATVTLYVAIFNLFTSLLHLIGFMSGDD
ncbi:modulator of FtsH protease [Alteromonadaceae bacterium Bs31]|nr:modulator of FtsH protease [Alteromonadaceae bacterium Bs31]